MLERIDFSSFLSSEEIASYHQQKKIVWKNIYYVNLLMIEKISNLKKDSIFTILFTYKPLIAYLTALFSGILMIKIIPV